MNPNKPLALGRCLPAIFERIKKRTAAALTLDLVIQLQQKPTRCFMCRFNFRSP